MKQYEIKIPLRCITVLRLLAIGFILVVNTLMYSTRPEKLFQEPFFVLNGMMFGIWGMMEFVNYMITCFDNEKPVFPFKFKCKCDDDK